MKISAIFGSAGTHIQREHLARRHPLSDGMRPNPDVSEPLVVDGVELRMNRTVTVRKDCTSNGNGLRQSQFVK